ncbi:hypothetical protein D3C81_1995480 [compost metagenome]
MATPTFGVSVLPEFAVLAAVFPVAALFAVSAELLLLPPQPAKAAPSNALASKTEVSFFII